MCIGRWTYSSSRFRVVAALFQICIVAVFFNLSFFTPHHTNTTPHHTTPHHTNTTTTPHHTNTHHPHPYPHPPHHNLLFRAGENDKLKKLLKKNGCYISKKDAAAGSPPLRSSDEFVSDKG
jgi:hypothetical protein